MSWFHQWPFFFFIVFFSTLFSASLQAHVSLSRTQLLMGNVLVSITLETSSGKREEGFAAMEAAFQEAKRLEEEVSEWRPQSQTSLLNRSAGRYLVPIGQDLVQILQLASEISFLTDGAFDITFPSLRKNGADEGEAVSQPSFRNVVVLPELGLAFLPKGITIGLSGIAKGYIVDRMNQILRQRGFRKFLINAGDLSASGRWEIGIRDPEGPPDQRICQITVKDRAVSTSGLYERGGHIINSKTGKVPHHLQSATVIASSSAFADGLATGLFVLGKEGGSLIFDKRPEIGILLIDSQGVPASFGRVSAVCRGRSI